MYTRTIVKALLALAIAFLVLSSSFFMLNLCTTAEALPDSSGWTLLVGGLVVNSLNLTDVEIYAMPKTTVYAELYCVDYPSNALARGNWTGVKLGFLLEEAQVLSGALKVAFHANDGYSSDLPLTVAMSNDVIIAYELDSQPLPESLRLVVPGRWGYKWVSNLVYIDLVDYDFRGTWESGGYPDEANIPFLRVDLNKDGGVDVQDIRIVATAFGSRPGGPEWNEAADLDWNGWINILDVTHVGKDFGKTSNP